ncbi:MAG TPA: thioredoxin family protein [Methylibium sp.]|nr:thioredoxin family protein [Methylibium sp.]
MRALLLALAILLSALPAAAAGFPAAYGAVVIQPVGLPDRAEFDLTAVAERARRENKRLYVYLGARDCRFCRRYEAFLDRHAAELVPHFQRDYVVADLRSSLSVLARSVYIKLGASSRSYTEFQTAIGDERVRQLVYPNIWILDADGKPLMQMPSGAGTFETVAEQIEVLQLVQ